MTSLIRNRRRSRLVTAAIVSAVVFAGAACSDDSPDTGGTAPSSGGAASPELATLLEDGYRGTFQAPPTEGPKAAAGKKVWVISCGQVAESCALIANSAMSAGKALGWNMTLFDGKLDPSNYSQGILQALAAGADGIMTTSVDCSAAKAPLEQAKKAGVFTTRVSGFDCDDTLEKNPGQSLYSTYPKYTGIDGYGATLEEWRKYSVAWMVGKTGGKAKVINTTSPGYLISAHKDKGLEDTLKLCPDCKMVQNLGISASDQAGPTAQQKLLAAFNKHSDANVFQIGAGGWFGRFANAAIRSSGRTDIHIAGDECDESAIKAIKGAGPVEVCVARDWKWEAWAAMDQLNRKFSDPASAPADQGLGFQIVDKEHGLPDGDHWSSPFDYQAAYKKIWQG